MSALTYVHSNAQSGARTLNTVTHRHEEYAPQTYATGWDGSTKSLNPHLVRQLLNANDGESEIQYSARGDDRRRFNLGHGCRWKTAERNSD
jgi:hypothetical protein